MSLPMSCRFSPVSTITAYTTATEVVLKAMPPISAACKVQWSTSRHKAKAPASGRRKDTKPMARLDRQCRRSVTGSISAPAKNVRRTEPTVARKVVNAVCWIWPLTTAQVPEDCPDDDLDESHRYSDSDADE